MTQKTTTKGRYRALVGLNYAKDLATHKRFVATADPDAWDESLTIRVEPGDLFDPPEWFPTKDALAMDPPWIEEVINVDKDRS